MGDLIKYNAANFVRVHGKIFTLPIAWRTSDPTTRNVGNIRTNAVFPHAYGWPSVVAMCHKMASFYKRVMLRNPFGVVDKSADPTYSDPANNPKIMTFDQRNRAKTGGYAITSGLLPNATGIHDPLLWLSGDDLNSWGDMGKPDWLPDWGNKTGHAFVDAMRIWTQNGIQVIVYIGSPNQVGVGADVKNPNPADYPLYQQICDEELGPIISGGCDIAFDATRGGYRGNWQATEIEGSHVHNYLLHLINDYNINVYIESWPEDASANAPPAFHYISKSIGMTLTNDLLTKTTSPADNNSSNIMRFGVVYPQAMDVSPIFTDAASDMKVATINQMEETKYGVMSSQPYFTNIYEFDIVFDEVIAANKNAWVGRSAPAGNPSIFKSNYYYSDPNQRIYNGNSVVMYGGSVPVTGVLHRSIKVGQLADQSDPLLVQPQYKNNGDISKNYGVRAPDIDDISRKYAGRFKNPRKMKKNNDRMKYSPASVSVTDAGITYKV